MTYPELETERLRLRMWRESDLDDYAEMSADPLVMKYLTMGKPFTRALARHAWGKGYATEGTARVNDVDVLVYGIDRP